MSKAVKTIAINMNLRLCGITFFVGEMNYTYTRDKANVSILMNQIQTLIQYRYIYFFNIIPTITVVFIPKTYKWDV